MLYKQGHIYIMTNQYRTTFYIGVTSDLRSRVWQHINNEGSDFVKKYKLYDLVFYEYFERIADAIDREKQVKLAQGLENQSDKVCKSRNKRFEA